MMDTATALMSASKKPVAKSLNAPNLTAQQVRERAKEQAKEFEAVFLNTMLKQMFSGVGKEGAEYGGGQAEGTWRGLQVEEYSKTIAANGGIGLAADIERQLLGLQEIK